MRAALVIVLIASALKLFEVPTAAVGAVVAAATVGAVVIAIRRRPAFSAGVPARPPNRSTALVAGLDQPQDRRTEDETDAKGAQSQ